MSAVGWDCTYKLGANGNPHSIQAGTVILDWALLYAGVSLMCVVFPGLLIFNCVADRKKRKEMDDILEQSRLYQSEMEASQSAARMKEFEAKQKIARSARDPF